MDVEDFHSRLKELYLPPEGRFSFVDVPEIRYMAMDGLGVPENQAMMGHAKWLFSLVDTFRPAIKKRMGRDFAEPPLECLFWADDPADLKAGRTDRWSWRVMIVLVDWITTEQFEDAVTGLAAKGGPPPATPRLVVEEEGRSVQRMNVGNYAGIRALCTELHDDFLPANQLEPNGCYHEIYLNDPVRTAQSRRKVVIRQPVK